MSPVSGGSPRLTYRDFLKFPDDGKRHELIDGVHYVSPSPFAPHQRALGNLYFLMRLHLEEHRQGEVFIAPVDVVLSMFDVVEPDLLFISSGRAHIVKNHVHGSPDLVVEVTSSATRQRDEGIKLALYERCDVLEYWVIDPDGEIVRTYRRHNDRLKRVPELTRSAGAALTTPLLPGLELPLDRLFGA